jgi:uncharacterized membrane protein YqiK
MGGRRSLIKALRKAGNLSEVLLWNQLKKGNSKASTLIVKKSSAITSLIFIFNKRTNITQQPQTSTTGLPLMVHSVKTKMPYCFLMIRLSISPIPMKMRQCAGIFINLRMEKFLMNNLSNALTLGDGAPWFFWLIPLVILAALWRTVLWVFGVIIIPEDSIGVVNKKFVLSNKQLPANRIMALNGEAGYQADTLGPGLHIGFWPWQYVVEKQLFFEVPAGNIGLVEAVDGDALPNGRVVAAQIDCDDFQDARAFLTRSGQRGPQMSILPPGKWRINTYLFKVRVAEMVMIQKNEIGVVEAKDGAPLSNGAILAQSVLCNAFQDAKAFMDNGGQRGAQMDIIPQGQYRINPYLFTVKNAPITDIPDNKIGVITTKEGRALDTGDIAGAAVEGHNSYQNAQAFITQGGNKGLQEQVLMPGRYFINPSFATVDIMDMTTVPIAHAGVIISYVGREGHDVTGEFFKHGNLVQKGERGVCVDPLDPGKYPINPFTHSVKNVPTANVVLNWADTKNEAHRLDEKLSTITVRSSDGFTFNLDVSQIIHIPRNDAPKVIASFGSVESLVTQVLEPMIGNYFRNAAQGSDVIDFLKHRTERQKEAKEAIAAALNQYNVGAIETLIGDIVPPEALMKTLTDRKIADQERVTYETQQLTQTMRQKLEQATALAATQAQVVDAERKVAIAEFAARAAIENAKGQAQSKTINAEADAKVLITVGNAEANKVLAIGQAEAKVIKEKIDSMESGNYAVVQVAEALAKAGVKLVPDIMVSGSGSNDGGANGGIVNVLMANLLKDSMKDKPGQGTALANTTLKKA